MRSEHTERIKMIAMLRTLAQAAQQADIPVVTIPTTWAVDITDWISELLDVDNRRGTQGGTDE